MTHKDTSYYDGYVYNLETRYGFYVYNNIVTHNCLHTLLKYTTIGKTDKQIQRDKDFSSFEKRPANVDYRSKRQIAAYREKEKARAQFRNDRKQFEKYREALGDDMPKTFETFIKHKRLDDDAYKMWESEFRSFSIKSAKSSVDLLKSNIEFDFRGKDEKYKGVKEIITNLEKQYKTRLRKVTLGAVKAAGDVDMYGDTMRLNTIYPETAIHEFAHTLANTTADKLGLTSDSEFWKEIRKIRTAYRKNVGQNSTRWISSYADSGNKLDEFMAEGFAHAKMRELGITIPDVYGNDFTYSQQVLDVINKYFGL